MESKTLEPVVEMVTVTVNGVEHHYPKGKNLLAALLGDDIPVPHYCWHPSLSVAGNCRLCMVEMEGNPRPGISCNMTCTDGLKIKTESELVTSCREGMMEFLLVNHPLDCPVCDRGGECMLQRYSMDYGIGTARVVDERRRFEKPQFDPLIDIERNRCILCTRCVRFMDEIGDEHSLAIYGRGNRNYIGTFGDGPVANIFSGNIIDICPVGCLTSKPYRFKARAWELQQVVSTCMLCSAGCETTTWLRDGKIMRTTPPARREPDGQFTIDEDTEKFICNEGRFGNYYANHEDRLTTALKRQDESMVVATWDDALDLASGALREAAEQGPGKIAILAGPRATNEEYYLLSRLARSTLGTNQIDWRTAFISDDAAQMAGAALSASDGDLDLLDAGEYDVTLVVNAELRESTPVISLRVKEAARCGKTKLVVLDSALDGWLSDQAEIAAVEKPGELGAVVRGLLEALRGGGAAVAELRELAQIFKAASSGLIILGLDTAGGALNHDLVPAVLDLARELGAAWDFLPVVQARNAKGAMACGAQSDRLPGGSIDGKTGRNRLAEFWGTLEASSEAGPTAPAILRAAARGEITTLLLHRCDDLVYHPQRELIEKAIEATPNVIVIDVFPSWITEAATVVLPGAFPFETEGSIVGADGEMLSLVRGNQPPGDAQEDWRIIQTLDERLGSATTYRSVGEIFSELLVSIAPARPFRLVDLRLEGPGSESPQRPQSAFGKAERPTFKVRSTERPELKAGTSIARPVSEGKLALMWFYAIQGADHLGAYSTEFAELRPEASIQLNPEDARDLGVGEGDRVTVDGAVGSSPVVRLNETLPRGIARAGANAIRLRMGSDDAETAGLPQIAVTKATGAPGGAA